MYKILKSFLELMLLFQFQRCGITVDVYGVCLFGLWFYGFLRHIC